MKKILVTGAAGFIGFHTVQKLLLMGCEVIGLDNINDYYPTSLKYDRLEELGIKKNNVRYNTFVSSCKTNRFKFIKMDIEDAAGVMLLFRSENFDKVIHLAAQAGVRYSLDNPKSYVNSNIVGFLNILEACRYFNIKHLVYASSSSVYGMTEKQPFVESDETNSPISLYAATKKANELMAYTYSHLYKLPTTGLRFFTVYGPWGRPDMAPFLFAKAISNQETMQVFNYGEMYRDFTYIDDVINGIYKACMCIPNGCLPQQVLNIGNGKPVNLMDFISCLETSLGKSAIKQMVEIQKGDVVKTWADTSKIKSLINYQPSTTINDGIEQFVIWYKKYYCV